MEKKIQHRFFFLIFLLLSPLFFACPSNEESKPLYDQIIIPTKKQLSRCPLAEGFDFPVGAPNASGYFNALKFGKNKHLGEDWNGLSGGNSDLGDPIFSIANGIVFFVRDVKVGWCSVIRIVHNIGTKKKPVYIESLYGHVEKILVKEGDMVRRGKKIAQMGNCKGRYSAHLHFEMRKTTGLPIGGGYSSNRKGFINPTKFIKKNRP